MSEKLVAFAVIGVCLAITGVALYLWFTVGIPMLAEGLANATTIGG